MAKCSVCNEDVPRDEVFKHLREKHPEEARAFREKAVESAKQKRLQATSSPARRGNNDGAKGTPPPQRPTQTKGAAAPIKKAHALTPVHAALVEFTNQTFVVPNTLALTYGYICARKFGFQGDLAMFLQEVIDDFYARRGVNYYTEVTGWTEIGSALKEAAPDKVEAAAPA